MLFSIYPIVFQEKRGWNAGVGELPLIGTVVGALIGGLIIVLDSNRQVAKMARLDADGRQQQMRPEDRLVVAMFGGIGFAACMFWLAWSGEYKLSPCPPSSFSPFLFRFFWADDWP